VSYRSCRIVAQQILKSPTCLSDTTIMRKIAVAGFKGGVGKTTTAVNLAVALARDGHRALLLDLDSQANCTDGLGVSPDSTAGIFGLLVGGVPFEQVAVSVEENLDLVPASRALSTVDNWLLQRPRPAEVLGKRLSSLEGYEFVIADLPPAFSQVSLNGLMFAEEVWLPVSMEYFALQGVKQVLETLRMLRDEAEHTVRVRWVIPTFHDSRNAKTRAVMDVLEEKFKAKVTRPVRLGVRLSEAPSHHKSIFDFAPDSAGAEDYRIIARSILNAEIPTAGS